MGKPKQIGIDPNSVIDDFFKYVKQYRAASLALDKENIYGQKCKLEAY